MKVGILTFPNSTSFGASLQMHALYHVLNSLGVQTEIINYQNEFMKAEQHTAKMNNADPIYKKLRLWTKRVLHARLFRGFRSFEKTLTIYPQRMFSDSKRLFDIGNRYDAVICGSDQVWNPNITGQDLSYFLNFCSPSTKRISYAPSFGISEFTDEFKTSIRKELEQFVHLSAREIEGKQLLVDLLGREVPLVLDPTLLLSSDYWSEIEKSHSAASEPYVLYYTVTGSDSLFRFALKLAEKKNVKLIVVGGNFLHQLRNRNTRVSYAYDLEPREWLYMMHHADCVVTNSFHGTAFSINYQKDFYVEFSSATNSRLEQIIRITGLENRVVQNGCAKWDEHIDYAHPNKMLNMYRDQSMDYLKNSLI